jgi:hypothetical protein
MAKERQMGGVKGRTGKAITPEQKEAKSRAGKIGMASRWGTPPDPSLPPPLRPSASLPPPPSLEDRDSDDPIVRIGKPFTWPDELKKEQVRGEQLANEKRAIEIQKAAVELEKAKDERDIARGKLLTRDAHRQAVGELVAELVAGLDGLVGVAAALVPPEQQPGTRHAMAQAIAKIRADMAARMKGG